MTSPVMMNEELVERWRDFRRVNASKGADASTFVLAGETIDLLRAQATLIEQLSNRVERQRAALEPFARYYVLNDCAAMDDDTWSGNLEVPISDLKRAHDALTGEHNG